MFLSCAKKLYGEKLNFKKWHFLPCFVAFTSRCFVMCVCFFASFLICLACVNKRQNRKIIEIKLCTLWVSPDKRCNILKYTPRAHARTLGLAYIYVYEIHADFWIFFILFSLEHYDCCLVLHIYFQRPNSSIFNTIKNYNIHR